VKTKLCMLAGVCCLVFGILGFSARADVIYLKGKQPLEGKIVREGKDSIVLEVSHGKQKGTVKISRSEIERIERKITPQEEFQQRLLEIAQDDAEAFLRLGKWAKEKGLTDEANFAFERALEINPKLEEAGKLRGWLFIDNRWQPPAFFIDLADANYRAKRYEKAINILERLLQQPIHIVHSDRRKVILFKLARCYEALGRWNDALDAYERILKCHPQKNEVFLLRVREKIIKEHPDGKYNCSFDNTLFKNAKLQAAKKLLGVQDLSRPEVMDFAVRQEAKALLREAEQRMVEAEATMIYDREEAKRLYEDAKEIARRADWLVPGISMATLLKIANSQVRLADRIIAKEWKKVQRDIGFTTKRGAYPGSVDLAQQFVDKVQTLCEQYEKKIQLLTPFAEKTQKQVQQIEKEKQKGEDLLSQAQRLLEERKDYAKIYELEAEARKYRCYAMAWDPKSGVYGFKDYRGSDGIFEFREESKEEWVKRSDMCAKFAEKAIDALQQQLALMRRYPNYFSRDIFYARRYIDQMNQLWSRVKAERNKKGGQQRRW